MKKVFTVLVGFVCCLVVFNVAVYGQGAAGNGVTVAGGNGNGSAANQLSQPDNIFVDESGNMYITDFANNRVQKWSIGATSGFTVAGGHGQGREADQLDKPFGVFVDRIGNVYVADQNNNRVQKWAPEATSGITIGKGWFGIDSDEFYIPICVFVDDTGNLYVADAVNNRVQKWAANDKGVTTVAGDRRGKSGSTSKLLDYPAGLFVDHNGNIYVADVNNNRIQEWSPGADSGVTVAGGNGVGHNSNQLLEPLGVSVDSSGNVYVADTRNHRIQKWAPGANKGITVAGDSTGMWGSAANQLYEPDALFLDNKGNFYVADEINDRIQRFGPANDIPIDTAISFFPNPTRSELTINTAGNKIEQIRVFNINEQKVEESSNPLNNKIEVDEFAKGIYFIEVTLRGGTVLRRKFVKE